VGTPREAPPSKLFMAIMHRPRLRSRARSWSSRRTIRPGGEPVPPFLFDGSRYYEPEMGSGLIKFFVSFKDLFPRSGWRRRSWRPASSNPGNPTPGEGVQHRSRDRHALLGHPGHDEGVCPPGLSGDGVYAEATLLFRRGALESLPWTYPDYRGGVVQSFFTEARRILLKQLSGADASGTSVFCKLSFLVYRNRLHHEMLTKQLY